MPLNPEFQRVYDSLEVLINVAESILDEAANVRASIDEAQKAVTYRNENKLQRSAS